MRRHVYFLLSFFFFELGLPLNNCMYYCIMLIQNVLLHRFRNRLTSTVNSGMNRYHNVKLSNHVSTTPAAIVVMEDKHFREIFNQSLCVVRCIYIHIHKYIDICVCMYVCLYKCMNSQVLVKK